MRRLLFSIVISCLFAHGSAGSVAAAEPAQRPNVLWLMVDDLRWDTFSHVGHAHVKTPHIDRLAKEGVAFNNAFVTTSICWSSRYSFLSGRYYGSSRKERGANPRRCYSF
jgi:hypothetical protein